MPAKHHTDEPFLNPWLIAAVLIVVAGFAIAGMILFRGYQERPEDPSPTREPVSEAPGETAMPEPTAEPEAVPTAIPTPGPIPDNGQDGTMNNGVYVWNNMAFELFFGTDEAAEPYAQAIESFAQQVPGVNVYSMVVPNHSEFGLPERLRNSLGCGSQRENTNHIYDMYSTAIPVDIYDVLDLHKDEYIYYNTDFYWTVLGAHYAYEAFCETAGARAVPLSDFTLEEGPDYFGYFCQLTGDQSLRENPDHVDLYEPSYPYTATVAADGWSFTELPGINGSDTAVGYGMYLWGDQPILHVVNEFSYTQRKLALVKESYGNPLGPFLAASFDEVYAIDFRYYPGGLMWFVQEYGITDVLFVTGDITANSYGWVEELKSKLM